MVKFITLAASAVILLFALVNAANNIWTYTSGTRLIDADPNYFRKLDTRVLLDPLATPTTYIICIATISSQQNLIHVEQRKFVVGQTGAEGPELVPFDPPFNISKDYRDLDIIDGADQCLLAVLSQDQYLTIASQPPERNYWERIKVVSQNGTFYLALADSSIQSMFAVFLGYTVPSYYSFETTVEKSGRFWIASSNSPTENQGMSLLGSDHTDILTLTDFRNCTFPTLAAFNESWLILCAEHPLGVPCAFHPSFDVKGKLVITNSATLTYTKPRISKVNDTSNLMFLSALLNDTTQPAQNGLQIEVDIVDALGQRILQRRFTRDSPYLMDSVSIDNYLFLTYADSTGLKMDVMYWGDAVPPFPTPISPPIAEPIATPESVPMSSPASAPVTQTDVTPFQQPTTDQNIDGAPQGGLPGSSIGAIVGSIVGAALAAGAIVLAVLLTRRNRQRKAAKQNEAEMSSKEQDSTSSHDSEEMSSKQQDSTSSQDSPSSSSSVTPYDAVIMPNSHLAQEVTQNPVRSRYTTNPPSHNSENLLIPQPTSNVHKETALPAAEIEKRMKIPFKSLVFNFELGSGNFGKVFKGEWYGAEVAIKVSNQVTNTEEFLAEAKLTLGISPHPNLVQTLGVSLDGPNPCIVLGFCGGGSLDRLLKDKSTPLDNTQKRDYALKIAYGLLHLHQNNIVHRDLAARNILLANDGTPKISDFGMSRVITSASSVGRTKQTIGPLRWMAPENIKNQMYSVKSDVWSYGILVWEIVARREPHLDADQLLVGARIRDEGYHPSIPNECEPVLKRVMEMCWQKEPKDRPTMEEIVDVLRSNQK